MRTTANDLMFAKRAVGGLKAVAAATKPSAAAIRTIALCAATPQRKLGSSIFLSPSTQQRLASSVASHNLPSTPTSEPWLSPPPQNEPLPSLNEAAVTAPELSPSNLHKLIDHVANSQRLLVVTGAGISTASGIPDYRSPNGSYSRGHKPIQHAEFVNSEKMRRRYWTRSFVGWRYFSRAEPNVAHLALAELEARGRVYSLVTQNVDGLHSAAGHQDVLDLHGRIDAVECLSCGHEMPRADWQRELASANAKWVDSIPEILPGELRADGDSEIAESDDFVVPHCPKCGHGTIKPSVVFFGGSVPPSSVQAAADAVNAADALLVVGSSLQVFSAFRIARTASQRGIPIAILNNGPTRADDLDGVWRVEADACEALPRLAAELL